MNGPVTMFFAKMMEGSNAQILGHGCTRFSAFFYFYCKYKWETKAFVGAGCRSEFLFQDLFLALGAGALQLGYLAEAVVAEGGPNLF